jgi:hypothetical protein
LITGIYVVSDEFDPKYINSTNALFVVEMESLYKSIRIKNDTYENLKRLGSLQDTYDSVIRNLILKEKEGHIS